MKILQTLYAELEKQEKLHSQEIFNYVVPESWNLYGYTDVKKIRSKEIIINPYRFYYFSLHQMLKDEQGNWKQSQPFTDDKAVKGTWLKKANIYAFMARTATAWDHDRDGILNHDNLYHLSDNGTFLKSILLLPFLKRMHIDTILLHQPFALCKTQTAHDYAAKEAVIDFQKIDDQLQDQLLPTMSAEDQCIAFVEACHFMGIRVILEYCPGKLARENAYYHAHPEWFYWIDGEAETHYHAPICHGLAQNTIPFTFALKDFYKSDDVQKQLTLFKESPIIDEDISLVQLQKTKKVTIAPAISDQINANIPADRDTTIFRFFHDSHVHIPYTIANDVAPFMLQDTIRADLHPGKLPQSELWDMLNALIPWYQDTLQIDGIYLEKPYLLPESLQKRFVKTACSKHKAFAMIAEDAIAENSDAWLQKGYDAISGNSAYEETNIWDFKFHDFAYRLKGNACSMFAASEFTDSRRVSCLDGGKTLTNMLCVMNQFLPNGIPLLMNGIESYEVQPLQLSEYGDQKYTYALPKTDPRYHKQAYIDQYYFNYTAPDLHVLPSLLEKTGALRKIYMEAITHDESCIPVWFDTPRDFGIGYTFILEDKALLVICNTNIHDTVHLHIHTENMLCELPFDMQEHKQIFSTEDPYIHDVPMDIFQNIPLDFAPGEVKFIEFT